eukprot:Skav201037  [mRNA]  locus=scaffold3386:200977:205965:+ [translate_table: standard]
MGSECSKSESPRHEHLPTLLTEQSREPAELLPGAKKVEKAVSCHASEGSRWHSELVSVSSELREKLQDPHFVASRCDLDGSGNLDPHELKQAARVYGISLSCKDQGHQQMAKQLRISKEDFAEMVASRSQGSTKVIRTIPHSLRGMALGQLLHLEALFIKSGWLDNVCESFNRENATDIANGQKFAQNRDLYALDTFVVTPMSGPGMCEAREHDPEQTIAKATGKSSFSELVNPWGLWVHCFVSHFWGHDFSRTVAALELWAAAHYQKMTSEKFALVFWICLFALNQHNVAEEVGESPQQGPFNAALAQATGGAVIVLDEEVKPFSRIWCLFEVFRLKDLQRPFELICAERSLSLLESACRTGSVAMLRETCEALWKVSAAKAESSVAEDKYQIWAEIANESFRGEISKYGAQNFFARGDVGEAYFSDFDKYMQELLSTKMLRLFMARGQYAEAANCCRYGADMDSEQISKICNLLQHRAAAQREKWLNIFLGKTSVHTVVQHRIADAVAHVRSYVALLRQLPKLGNSWMQLLERWDAMDHSSGFGCGYGHG